MVVAFQFHLTTLGAPKAVKYLTVATGYISRQRLTPSRNERVDRVSGGRVSNIDEGDDGDDRRVHLGLARAST